MFIFILIATCLAVSDCQICRKTEMVLKEVPVTHQYTYEEVVHDPSCWFVNCMKTETKTAKDVNMVEKYEPQEKLVCCEGYEEIILDDNSTSSCEPKCSTTCENAKCTGPETCTCNEGYTNSPNNPNICLPICVVSTDDCESPDHNPENTCTLGYYDDDSCRKLCSEHCQNGYCIGHDTCLCKHGFIKQDKFVCVKNCTDCECNEGWYSKNGECIPICERMCENGTCIAPNTCDCLEGYEPSKDSNECQPVCECVGVCISPNVCSCEMPYDIDIVGGKETCVLTEYTTIDKETNDDTETILTTDDTNSIDTVKSKTNEKFSTKPLNVIQINVSSENEKNIQQFLKKNWHYFLLCGIIVIAVIVNILLCVTRGRKGKLTAKDSDIAVTYQKDP